MQTVIVLDLYNLSILKLLKYSSNGESFRLLKFSTVSYGNFSNYWSTLNIDVINFEEFSLVWIELYVQRM